VGLLLAMTHITGRRKMRTIVERMLPQEFLVDLGTYLQTAAHIELTVWQTMMYADGADLTSAEVHREYVEIKLTTWQLLKRFRKSAENCPPELGDRILTIAGEIAIGLEARNMAAHGAFFLDQHNPGALATAHFMARGQRKNREVFEASQTVTREDVTNVIRVADKLLTDVIALHQEVRHWRQTEKNGIPPADQGDT
jgi:hypothetical protein